ncbi:hypothetical protein HPB47_011340, partial [Ixodes persulcatus]
MVWLFGGALLTGSAADGAVLAAYGDVVVVTLNYRLKTTSIASVGVLTRLHCLDKVRAPRSVTFHLLSPITQFTVRKAIIQSGG